LIVHENNISIHSNKSSQVNFISLHQEQQHHSPRYITVEVGMASSFHTLICIEFRKIN